MIKNTDNGILLINEFIVDGQSFKVQFGDVLEKGKFAEVLLYSKNDLEFNCVFLVGTDIKGNLIKYQFLLDEKKKYIERIIEVEV